MADDIYIVDLLATGNSTIMIDDDGTGSDWIVIQGTYPAQTDIRLSWTIDEERLSSSGMGFYYNPGNTGHRLIVNGLIENARGSNGQDFIQGNEAANILYGDAASSGDGGSDSLYGQDGNDTIFGGSGDDWIDGGNHRDLLQGNAGSDTISGGAGIDTIIGGAGADSLSGGSDIGDTVSYARSTAAVQIELTAGSATIGVGGDAEGDTIFGFTRAIGSSLGDTIRDTVAGDIGNGTNANLFQGGRGADWLYMGGGNDTARGGDAVDRIFGEQGRDYLYGDAGNDQITGGTEADVLFGGADADRFIFTALNESTLAATGRDVIRDFSHAEGDQIDLRQIDAQASAGGNNAFTFIGSSGFTQGVEGQLRAVQVANGWLVSGDVDGDRAADFSILVVSATALVAGDFML